MVKVEFANSMQMPREFPKAMRITIGLGWLCLEDDEHHTIAVLRADEVLVAEVVGK